MSEQSTFHGRLNIDFSAMKLLGTSDLDFLLNTHANSMVVTSRGFSSKYLTTARCQSWHWCVSACMLGNDIFEGIRPSRGLNDSGVNCGVVLCFGHPA